MRNQLPLVLVLVAVMASAVTAATVSVPDDIPGILEAIATAPVELDDATGLTAFNLDITYDTALLDLSNADVRTGSLVSGWSLVPNVDDAAGIAYIGCYDSGNPLPGGSGTLLEVDFHVISAPGMSPVHLEGVLNQTTPDFDHGSIVTIPEPSVLVFLLGGLLLIAPGQFRKRR